MSNEMIEKAAKALCCSDGCIAPNACTALSNNERVRAVRRVIQAMAEPTDEMINAGNEAKNYFVRVLSIYQVMIKAALKPDTQDAGEDAS